MKEKEPNQLKRVSVKKLPGFAIRLVSLLIAISWITPVVANSEHLTNIHDDIFAVTFADKDLGWVCGRWGNILHTTDGGLNWKPQSSGTDRTLVSIHFTDAKNGWAVGVKGTIVHTCDGGQTWMPQESPVDFIHMDVYFTNPRRGWIVSERTHILSTDDGGENWRIQFSDQDFILKAISFGDKQHGWGRWRIRIHLSHNGRRTKLGGSGRGSMTSMRMGSSLPIHPCSTWRP